MVHSRRRMSANPRRCVTVVFIAFSRRTLRSVIAKAFMTSEKY